MLFAKPGCVALDGRDHEVGDLVAARLPRSSVGKLVGSVLAEQARHMAAGRRQAVVEGGRDQHFDDGLAAPAGQAGIAESAVHVAKARRDDDAGRVVVGGIVAGRTEKLGSSDSATFIRKVAEWHR